MQTRRVKKLRAKDRCNGAKRYEDHADDGDQAHAPAVFEIDSAVMGSIDMKSLTRLGIQRAELEAAVGGLGSTYQIDCVLDPGL